MHLEFTLDVNDGPRMVEFWSSVLNYVVESDERFDEPNPVYWSLVDPAGRGPRLVIQRVPEPPSAKTRVHLDVHVDDLDRAAADALARGATRIDDEPIREVGAEWIRLADPEGTVFCFVRERRSAS